MAGLFVRGGKSLGSQPQEISPFEDRLRTTFRGSAKEQKVAIEKLKGERQLELFRSSLVARAAGSIRPALGAGSNVFKSNLGGT